MLEIETHAPTLDVDQEEHVLSLEGAFRLTERRKLLILGEIPVVLEDGVLVHELILNERHLVLELAEDDPAGGLLSLMQELLHCGKLGTGARPAVPWIAKGLALSGADVDLRMDGELAELHEELEFDRGCVLVEAPPSLHQLPLHALIELTLLL